MYIQYFPSASAQKPLDCLLRPPETRTVLAGLPFLLPLVNRISLVSCCIVEQIAPVGCLSSIGWTRWDRVSQTRGHWSGRARMWQSAVIGTGGPESPIARISQHNCMRLCYSKPITYPAFRWYPLSNSTVKCSEHLKFRYSFGLFVSLLWLHEPSWGINLWWRLIAIVEDTSDWMGVKYKIEQIK